MAYDQGHEQNNAVIKGDSGAIGLTEDEDALRRWMVAIPEGLELLDQYKADAIKVTGTNHHEQTKKAQGDFLKNILALTATFKELGNPFQDESEELYSLDTKDIVEKMWLHL